MNNAEKVEAVEEGTISFEVDKYERASKQCEKVSSTS